MYAEYRLDSDLLRQPIRRSGMTCEIRQWSGDHRTTTAVFWASGGDFDEFERELANDGTVANHQLLADYDDARIYGVQYTREMEIEGYRKVHDNRGVLHQAVNDGGDWTLSQTHPDKESFANFEQSLEELGYNVSTERILSTHSISETAGLTPGQQEILELAAAGGYFHVPRECHLSDLAAELDISTEAASERMRRALDNVVSAFLVDDSLHTTQL